MNCPGFILFDDSATSSADLATFCSSDELQMALFQEMWLRFNEVSVYI